MKQFMTSSVNVRTTKKLYQSGKTLQEDCPTNLLKQAKTREQEFGQMTVTRVIDPTTKNDKYGRHRFSGQIRKIPHTLRNPTLKPQLRTNARNSQLFAFFAR